MEKDERRIGEGLVREGSKRWKMKKMGTGETRWNKWNWDENEGIKEDGRKGEGNRGTVGVCRVNVRVNQEEGEKMEEEQGRMKEGGRSEGKEEGTYQLWLMCCEMERT